MSGTCKLPFWIRSIVEGEVDGQEPAKFRQGYTYRLQGKRGSLMKAKMGEEPVQKRGKERKRRPVVNHVPRSCFQQKSIRRSSNPVNFLVALPIPIQIIVKFGQINCFLTSPVAIRLPSAMIQLLNSTEARLRLLSSWRNGRALAMAPALNECNGQKTQSD